MKSTNIDLSQTMMIPHLCTPGDILKEFCWFSVIIYESSVFLKEKFTFIMDLNAFLGNLTNFFLNSSFASSNLNC